MFVAPLRSWLRSTTPRSLVLAAALLSLFSRSPAQELSQRPANVRPTLPSIIQEANTHPTYKALRSIGTGDLLAVRDAVLKRDAATFTLTGTLTFLAPVNGKVTGAVFFGQGTVELIPPIEVERKSLAELTKEPALHEQFDQAVFRFTDGTYEDLKRVAVAPPANSGGDPVAALAQVQKYLRKERKYNLDGRILEDVVVAKAGGLFWAFIHGRHVSSKLLFAVDPHGLTELGLAPEEVALSTYENNKFGTWAAFHFADEYKTGQARGSQYTLTLDIEHQNLDASFDKDGKLNGIAQTTFVSTVDGLSVVPFDLFHMICFTLCGFETCSTRMAIPSISCRNQKTRMPTSS